MTTDFLPKEYNDSKSLNQKGGDYMKFVSGANRFRIMGSPIVGWEWWEDSEDGKRTPKRVHINEKIDVSTVADPESIKRFWAMIVYNYDAKSLQILEITQKGIQKTLEELVRDEDWGTPVQTYDIVVTKTGEKMETKYEVLPKPKTVLDPGIVQLYKDMEINLDAMFSGDNPFKSAVGFDKTGHDFDKEWTEPQ
jgi:hypothetical protein